MKYQVGQGHLSNHFTKDHLKYQVGQDNLSDQTIKDHLKYQVGQDHLSDQTIKDHLKYQVGQDNLSNRSINGHLKYQVGHGSLLNHFIKDHLKYQVGQDNLSNRSINGHLKYQVGHGSLLNHFIKDHLKYQVGQGRLSNHFTKDHLKYQVGQGRLSNHFTKDHLKYQVGQDNQDGFYSFLLSDNGKQLRVRNVIQEPSIEYMENIRKNQQVFYGLYSNGYRLCKTTSSPVKNEYGDIIANVQWCEDNTTSSDVNISLSRPFIWGSNLSELEKWEIVKYVLNVEPQNIWKHMYIDNTKLNSFNMMTSFDENNDGDYDHRPAEFDINDVYISDYNYSTNQFKLKTNWGENNQNIEEISIYPSYDNNIWSYNDGTAQGTYFEFVRVSDKVGLKWYYDNESGFVNYSLVDTTGTGTEGIDTNSRVLSYSSECDGSLLFEAERRVFGDNSVSHGIVNSQDKMKDLILDWCTNSIIDSDVSQWNDYILQYEYSSNIKQRVFEWSVMNEGQNYDYNRDYSDHGVPVVSWRIINNGINDKGEPYYDKVTLLQDYYDLIN